MMILPSQQPGCQCHPSLLWRGLIAALLFAWGTFANAAEYQVEVLVFEHLDSRGVQTEYWPHPAALPDVSDAVSSSGAGIVAPVPPEQLSLYRYWDNLHRSQGFRPLLAIGWHQQLAAESSGVPVRIHAGPPRSDVARDGYVPHRLDGVIRVSRSRYLHVEADLIWIDSLAVGETPRGLQPYRAGPVRLDEPQRWQGFPLHQSRRIRLGELHYLDNPRFGVLLKVERTENN